MKKIVSFVTAFTLSLQPLASAMASDYKTTFTIQSSDTTASFDLSPDSWEIVFENLKGLDEMAQLTDYQLKMRTITFATKVKKLNLSNEKISTALEHLYFGTHNGPDDLLRVHDYMLKQISLLEEEIKEDIADTLTILRAKNIRTACDLLMKTKGRNVLEEVCSHMEILSRLFNKGVF